MSKLASEAPQRICDYFSSYLYKRYNGSNHVRRVSTWLGLILLGIHKLCDGEWEVSRTRQLTFSHDGQRYKARYNHQAGGRGGIEIVAVLDLQGSPDGATMVQITSLEDAEAFYNDPHGYFNDV